MRGRSGTVRSQRDLAEAEIELQAPLTDEERPKPTREKIEDARSCTDWPCLIIFILYLALMGAIMAYAYEHADLNRLTNGIDFQGNVCGSGNTSDFPYLYWCGDHAGFVGFPTSLNLDMPICVQACPDEFHEGMEYCPESPVAQLEGIPVAYGTAPYRLITTITQEVKEQPTYPTRYMANRYCVPNTISRMVNTTASAALMNQIQLGPMSSGAFQFAQAASSLHNNYRLLIAMGVAAILMSYTYLFILRVFAKPLVYLCLSLFSVGVIFCGIGMLVCTWVEEYHRFNPMYLHMAHQDARIWSSVIAAVLFIIGLIVCVIICCFGRVIQTAVGCIEAACECMFAMPTMLLEPLIGSILKSTIFLTLTGGLVALVSTGHITHAAINVSGTSVHGVAREVSFSERETYYLLLYIFGMFWILEYGDALQNFIISYAVTLWYYSENDSIKCCGGRCGGVKKPPLFPICRGLLKGVFFHSGSLAAGAFIIAVTRLISFIMKIIARHSEASGNKVVGCLASACVCCLECFRKVLEYINKNAYIDIVINSTWFLPAARHSFEFISSNPTTIGVLKGSCAIFRYIGVALPTLICSYFTYYLVTHVERWADVSSPFYVEDYLPITIAAGLICVCVCIVFMLVFDQAADTLLYVYIDNVVHDKETVETYAPKTLRDLVDRLPKESNNNNNNRK